MLHALLAAFLALWLPSAQPQDRYVPVRASADGIGKTYMGREIAHVMSFHGAPWLERPERTSEERPELVLAALELKPGMAVADLGAGSGYYSWRMARRVGDTGIVYAVDVQPEMIRLLGKQMAERGVANVKPLLGIPADPRLPEGQLDLVVMVDVYHELEYPYEVLASVVRALKPGGRVAFVEYRGNDPSVPIKALHTMTEAQVKKEASAQSLEWVKTVADLPWQQVIVFRRK
jgi:predicted methyltransferase